MSTAGYDVVVVGGGPAGSVAAFVLAAGGARVALVDKAPIGRDKACGDLIGPRGVRLLDRLGLSIPEAPTVGDMVVVGPGGRRVVLPARAGRTYPGHALVVPRASFDAMLRRRALEAGADDVNGRVAGVTEDGVATDRGALHADFVIGADGATSTVASTAGLVDADRALWGFAIREYTGARVTVPTIVLWNDRPRRGFPGYGWLFPATEGANLGLGLGVGGAAGRARAVQAQRQLPAFRDHLARIGLLDAPAEAPARRLGGWLKMGLVGTRPARGRVLLAGDAAGLVNPLQGEGIAQALESGEAAARAVLGGPGSAAATYLRWVADTYGSFASVTAPVHAALVGHPRRVAALGAVVTAPAVGRFVAPTWSLYWNDLTAGAAPSRAATAARVVQRAGGVVTSRSKVRRSLLADLGA